MSENPKSFISLIFIWLRRRCSAAKSLTGREYRCVHIVPCELHLHTSDLANECHFGWPFVGNLQIVLIIAIDSGADPWCLKCDDFRCEKTETAETNALAFSVSSSVVVRAGRILIERSRISRLYRFWTESEMLYGWCQCAMAFAVPEYPCFCICSRSIFGAFHWHDVVPTLWIRTVDGCIRRFIANQRMPLTPENRRQALGSSMGWPTMSTNDRIAACSIVFTSANALWSLFNAILTFLAVISPSLSLLVLQSTEVIARNCQSI